MSDDVTVRDEEILALAVSKPDSFEALVRRYEKAFLRKSLRILPGEPELAKDIVQDTFVKIYLNAARFKPREGASFKSWAYKILVNTCFTYYKKLKRNREQSVQLSDEMSDYLAAEESDAKGRLDLDEVLSLLSKLPEGLARVSRLHFVSGKPQKEIALLESISPGAVRARIHRAKKELKRIALEDPRSAF